DLASQEILERAVQSYPGTVLLISHDRALLEAVTTQVWLVEDGKVHIYAYGYTEFRRRRDEAVAHEKKGAAVRKASSKAASSAPKRTIASSREIEVKRQALETEIEFLEQKIHDIEQALVTASEAGDASRISDLGIEHKNTQDALTGSYEAWNELSEDSGE
ncbi:hypothetical protein KAR02_02270, partial [Candidatus Bipolaricaulota bacterium]|nr:hypothetical protein [Candidatus Bipolaricaulota bacterium]